VVGISKDSMESHHKFIEKFKLPFPLLSDEHAKVLKLYGAWGEKSMYGKKFMGIKRTTVLIGSNGTILKIWENVKVADHVTEVMDTVKKLVNKNSLKIQ
jgi:thioredoxin-dependent peroxiredoxin